MLRLRTPAVIAALILLCVAGVAGAPIAEAHPGGLDSRGCHSDASTGGYHCHYRTSPHPAPQPTVPARLLQPAPDGLHRVGPGESLHSIAARYGLAALTLLPWNPGLGLDSVVTPGDLIAVSAQAEPVRSPPNGTHTVAPGESLYAIAARYRLRVIDLIIRNPGLRPTSVVQPGDVLVVVRSSRRASPGTSWPSNSRLWSGSSVH